MDAIRWKGHWLVFFFSLQNLFFLFSQETYWGNPRNLTILNSKKDDFAPIWNPFEQRLFFSSTRNGISKFFFSNLIDSANFAEAIELPDPINRTKNNVSYITFLSETEAILNSFRKGKRQSYLNIFYSQRRSNQWQKPILLDSVECECFVLHPTVTTNGNYMIFSSNKDNPYNLDLYAAYLRPNGSWGGVSKITELNTDGNEITPFLAGDDTLYFASDGYGGPGGYDIFFSTKTDAGWSKPTPLSELNSRFNESDFVMINDRLAIFASDRPDGSLGGLDLFIAERTKTYQPVLLPNPELKISSQVASVRIQEELRYSVFEIPMKIDEIDFEKIATANANFEENLIPADLDSLKANILNIYFWRASRQGSKITLLLDTARISTLDKIQQYFNLFSTINPNIFNQIKIEHHNEKSILVSSEDPNVFIPLRIGKKEYSFEPPQLEVTLQANWKDMIQDWKIEIPLFHYSYKGKELPTNITIDLNESNFSKSRSDTLLLHYLASDTLGRHFEQFFPINLNYSFRAIEEEIFAGARRYNTTYLVADTFNIENRQSLDRIVDEIIAKLAFVRSISFIISADYQKFLVSDFISKLKAKTPLNQIEIRTENLANNEFYKKFYRPGFITLLIEK